MAQVINTNSLSLITQNNINKNQSALSTSIERLSSVCVLTALKMTPRARRLLTALLLTSKV